MPLLPHLRPFRLALISGVALLALTFCTMHQPAIGQTVFDFDVDETRSYVTMKVMLNPPIGSRDNDEATSSLDGMISAKLVTATVSFAEIHTQSMELVLVDPIDLDFNFGNFVGGLELEAPSRELGMNMSESGPPSVVTGTNFLQTANTFRLSGTLTMDVSGGIAAFIDDGDIDLSTALTFDMEGTITELDEEAELSIPLTITEETEVSGVPLTLELNGIVYANTSFTRVAVVDEERPAVIALEQNYPNPFNPQTKIAFTLDRPGEATLRIYDAVGRQVATLVDGSLSAGRHEAVFDATNHPSGVYHYRLTAGGLDIVRSMILLR